MEGVLVAYDRTVRDMDGSVIQFQYGEDGLDVAKTPYLRKPQFNFIAQNYKKYSKKYFGKVKTEPDSISSDVEELEKQNIKFIKRMMKNKWEEARVGGIERVQAFNDFLKNLPQMVEIEKNIKLIKKERHFTEERAQQIRRLSVQYNLMAVMAWHPVIIKKIKFDSEGNERKREYNLNPTAKDLKKDLKVFVPGRPESNQRGYLFPDQHPMTEENRLLWVQKRRMYDPPMSILSPDVHLGSTSEVFSAHVNNYKHQDVNMTELMQNLLFEKYRRSLVDPGDQVGLVVAQSIGEPSTQMTLNTFHLAGKSDVNITLGIPRLRELVMTAPTLVKTPSMEIPFHSHIKQQQAEDFLKSLASIRLSDIITRIECSEKMKARKVGKSTLATIKISLGSQICRNKGINSVKILKDFMEERFFLKFKMTLKAFEKALEKRQLIYQQTARQINAEVKRKKAGEEEGVEDDQPDDVEAEGVVEYGDSDREGADDEEPTRPDSETPSDDGFHEENSEQNEPEINLEGDFEIEDKRRIGELTRKFDLENYKCSYDQDNPYCEFDMFKTSQQERIDFVHVTRKVVEGLQIQGKANN